jgi:hypothetical protein
MAGHLFTQAMHIEQYSSTSEYGLTVGSRKKSVMTFPILPEHPFSVIRD